VPIDKIEHVLAGAAERGLGFATYSDFAHGGGDGPALALSFDDTSVDAWVALRPLFRKYHAHVTFFISRFFELPPEAREGLKLLASDGHAIEAHTVHHLHAPDYVDQNGLDAYLHDELDPSIQVLRDEGFAVDAFAYPFGVRTDQLDRAIGKRVPVIRSVSFSSSESPCPH
jgi:peptidoglycan/xylan/chitin deacetylase (PgdA/CDA1 family)